MNLRSAALRLLALPSRWAQPDRGELAFEELSSGASITRDERGVPRISAATDGDLYFAAGFAQACDRLWQMDVLRRRAYGRLSEIFGTPTAQSDVLARKLALSRAAAASQQLLSTKEQTALLRFSAGVNAAIRVLRRRGGLPPEFLLLRYRPEPWRPIDSIAIIKHLGFDLARNLRNEIFRANLRNDRPGHAAAFLDPKYPAGGATTIRTSPSGSSPTSGTESPLAVLPSSSQTWLRELLSGESAPGSNAWAVSGRLSASGYPLLANDPHIQFTQPSLWYQIGLSHDEDTAYGVTVPGLPGLVAGGNEHLAWGITNSTIDTQDLCVLTADTAPPGQWTQHSTVAVRGSTPVAVQAAGGDGYVEVDLPALTGEDRYGLFWSGFVPSTEIAGCLRMWRTRSYQEFREALRGFGVPVLNMIVASRGGIALKTAGRVPRRIKGSGLAPASHAEVAKSWRTFLSFDELPETVDPPEGYIVSANHKMLPDDADLDLGQDWGGPYRADRIEDLIGREQATASAFGRWQLDVVNGRAARVLPTILAALEESPPTEPMAKACHALLKDWDLRDAGELAAPLVFFRLMRCLTDDWVTSRLGKPLTEAMADITLQVDHLVLSPETRAVLGAHDPLSTVVARTLAATALLMSEELGADPARWRYDQVHRIADQHPLAGAVPSLFAKPPTPVGGGGQSVCLMYPNSRGEVVDGAPWRFVAELATTGTRIWDVLRHGSNGHPLSPHYDDQTAAHADGRLFPVPFTTSSRRVLRLKNPSARELP